MNIIVDSKFDPYSYEDLMKPIQNYDTAYRQLEDQYNTLATTAAALDSVSGEYSRGVIDNYRDQLNKATESFNQGMSFKDRQNLRQLKRHFATNVTPVVAAEESRKKFVEERNKIQMSAMSNGDTIKFKNENVTTDDFLKGKTPDNEFVSYNKVVQDTATKSAKLAQSLLTNRVVKEALNMPGTFEVTENNGITPEVLFHIINETYDQLDDATKKIADNFINIYNELDTKYSEANGWGQYARNIVKEGFNMGLYAALNSPKISYERDLSYTSPADNRRLAIAEAQERRTQEQWDINRGNTHFYEDDNGNKYYLTPTGGIKVKDKDGNRIDMTAQEISDAFGTKVGGLTVAGKEVDVPDNKQEETTMKDEWNTVVSGFNRDIAGGTITLADNTVVPNYAFKFRLNNWDDDLSDFRTDSSNTDEYADGEVQEYIRLSDMQSSTAKTSLLNNISQKLYNKKKMNELNDKQLSQFSNILNHVIIGIKRNSVLDDDGYVLFDYGLTPEQINNLLGNSAAESNPDYTPGSQSAKSAPSDTTKTGGAKTIELM